MSAERRAPQNERGILTQRAVVEGAARIFDEVGYGTASLSMIASASGVSQGSMYFHFKSKEQIAIAVMNEQHARTFAAISDSPLEGGSTVERLIRVSFRVADQLLKDSVVRAGIRLALEDGSLATPARPFYDDWVQSTAELVGVGMDRGELSRSVSADWLSRSLIGFFTGVQLMSQATSQRRDLVEALKNMWFILIAALAPASTHMHLRNLVENLAQTARPDAS